MLPFISVAHEFCATSTAREQGIREQERTAEPAWVGACLGPYRLRLARTEEERLAACRLRFRVFNLEMGEGLQSSYATGLDQDQFDYVCDHLLVVEQTSGEIVGTYRMQSGANASRYLGYYSEREFSFSPYEPLRASVLELGRASIDREHRTSEVLTLLWRGIAQYAQHHGLRYLLGCSSLTSHDPAAGWALFHRLEPQLVSPAFRTEPTTAFALPAAQEAELVEAVAVKVPKLLKTYLNVGSHICGAPAFDREFGTLDFLTLLDMEELTPVARSRFLCHQ